MGLLRQPHNLKSRYFPFEKELYMVCFAADYILGF